MSKVQSRFWIEDMEAGRMMRDTHLKTSLIERSKNRERTVKGTREVKGLSCAQRTCKKLMLVDTRES